MEHFATIAGQPDRDTFGPEDCSLSYRVLHHDAGSDIDDRTYPINIIPAEQEKRMALVNEWFEQRKLAEGIGGRFEVRSVGGNDAPPPAALTAPPAPVIAPTPSQPGLPSLSGRGLRSRVFGRKQV